MPVCDGLREQVLGRSGIDDRLGSQVFLSGVSPARTPGPELPVGLEPTQNAHVDAVRMSRQDLPAGRGDGYVASGRAL